VISYNTTIKVDWSVARDWLNWEQEVHIPAIMATGYFDHWKIYRLLDQDEGDGPTYSIQFFTSSQNRYQQYLQTSADLFRQRRLEKWKDRFIAHHSATELVK